MSAAPDTSGERLAPPGGGQTGGPDGRRPPSPAGPVATAAVLAAAIVVGAGVRTAHPPAAPPGGSPEETPAGRSTLRFTATAYCKGTTTAAGVRVRAGIAAADPSLLPLGSVVRVSTGIPRHDGVYTVLDTGPAVQGRVLDLYIWSCYEALGFGRRPVEITVLRRGWPPDASDPDEAAAQVRTIEADAGLPATSR